MISLLWMVYWGFLGWIYDSVMTSIMEFKMPRRIITPITGLVVTLLVIFVLMCILYN